LNDRRRDFGLAGKIRRGGRLHLAVNISELLVHHCAKRNPAHPVAGDDDNFIFQRGSQIETLAQLLKLPGMAERVKVLNGNARRARLIFRQQIRDGILQIRGEFITTTISSGAESCLITFNVCSESAYCWNWSDPGADNAASHKGNQRQMAMTHRLLITTVRPGRFDFWKANAPAEYGSAREE